MSPNYLECKDELVETKDSRQVKNDEPVVITSNSMVADTRQNTVTFIGSVKAVKGDMILLAEKMVVRYIPESGKIKDIEATGNINLTKGQSIIKSDKANYDAAEDKVVFVGNLSALVGKNKITGTKIIFYVSTERTVVENSSVHIIN
ncbi:MAG: hypothetical protein HQK91_13005 [Nitrospirae bacterium]|nr:hypothetical protein [Nitrospirota bacterium]